MIYIVFSDVHANLEALKAFAGIVQSIDHDKKVFLGDAVGYGADPNPCVEWIRGNADIILAGNHDYAAVNKTDIRQLNPHAYQSCLWTQKQLSPGNKEFLGSLPIMMEEGGICWVHSSPYEPENWHYVTSFWVGAESFKHFNTSVCFVGHSHIGGIYECDNENVDDVTQISGKLAPDRRYIINAGSIGQPRDGNPDPYFVVYDSDAMAFEYRRFKYDLSETQRKILQNGLPPIHAERLAYGS